jgi:hypothetical protein
MPMMSNVRQDLHDHVRKVVLQATVDNTINQVALLKTVWYVHNWIGTTVDAVVNTSGSADTIWTVYTAHVLDLEA